MALDSSIYRNALNLLTKRLLNISAKNKFINFRNPFEDNYSAIAFKKVPCDNAFEYLLKGDLLKIPLNQEDSADFFEENFDSSKSKLTKFKRQSISSLEETGSNCLFWAYSFLRFIDADKKVYWAPLYLMPVNMELTDEEVILDYSDAPMLSNFSLIEKLKSICEIPEIGDDTPDEYFNRLSAMLPSNWVLEKTNCLIKLSALNMILFNDLKDISQRSEYLENHPALGYFLDNGAQKTQTTSYTTSAYTSEDYPEIVTEADSSQMQVIKRAVFSDESFVIEGPPGTGKSQTITNIISSLIARGKKVLFVSEKMAALDVVKGRLEAAKLGPYVLALHNNKVHKKEVVQQLHIEKDYPLLAMPEALIKAEGLKQKILGYYSFARSQEGSDEGLFALIWKDVYESYLLPKIEIPDIAKFESWVKEYLLRNSQINGYCTGDTLWALKWSPEFDAQRFATEITRLKGSFTAVDFYNECGLSYLKENNINLSDFLEATKKIVPFLKNKPNSTQIVENVKNVSVLKELVLRLKTPDLTEEQAEKLERIEQEIFDLNDYFVDSCYVSLHPAEVLMDFDRLGSLKIHELATVLNGFLDCQSQTPVSFYNTLGFNTLTPIRVLEDFVKVLAWFKEKPAEAYKDVELADFIVNDTLSELIANRLQLIMQRDGLMATFDMDLVASQFTKAERDFCAEALLNFEESRFKLISKLKFGLGFGGTEQTNIVIQFFDYFSNTSENIKPMEKLKAMDSLLMFLNIEDDFKAKFYSYKFLTKYAPDDLDLIKESSDWLLDFPKNALKLNTILKNEGLFKPIHSAALPALLEHTRKLGIEGLSVKYLTESAEAYASFLENLEEFLAENPEFENRSCSDVYKAIKLKSEELMLKDQIQAMAASKDKAGFESLTVDEISTLAESCEFLNANNPHGFDVEAMFDAWGDLNYYEAYCEVGSFEQALINSFNSANLNVFENRLILSDTALLKEYVTYLATNIERVSSWVAYLNAKKEGISLGFSSFIDFVEEAYNNPGEFAKALISAATTKDKLSEFLASVAVPEVPSEAEMQEFNKMDSLIVHRRGYVIGRNLADKLTTVEGKYSTRVKELTEGKLLSHLQKYPGARISLRDILINAKESIQIQKPCFMMGPQAIAQFLDKDSYEFDVVIIDEASQMRLEHSIGAIARAKRAIIVGDPKQLGPSFTLAGQEAETTCEEAIEALKAESVLTWAQEKLNSFQLKWHYRSIHPSLIEFSNRQFYDNSLMVLPCSMPVTDHFGFNFQYVAGGFFDNSTNQKEASLVVKKCIEHMENHPDKSLGVITVNEVQAEYIENMLRAYRFTSLAVRDYLLKWTSSESRFFVKNIENVQGDERDTIIVSFTYGPNFEKNEVKQNFGALSKEDGWRRLNVVLSRAKSNLIVYSSLKASDIKEASNKGVAQFQMFLDYAESYQARKKSIIVQDAPDFVSTCNYFENTIASFVYEQGLNLVKYSANGLPCPLYLVCDNFNALGLIQGSPYFYAEQELRDTSRVLPHLLKIRGWKNIYYLDPLNWLKNKESSYQEFISFLQSLSSQATPPSEATDEVSEDQTAGCSI